MLSFSPLLDTELYYRLDERCRGRAVTEAETRSSGRGICLTCALTTQPSNITCVPQKEKEENQRAEVSWANRSNFSAKERLKQSAGNLCKQPYVWVRGKGFLIDLNLKERNIRTKHSSNILHKSLIDVCECSYISSCYESKYPANIFFFYVPTRISLMFSCVYSHYVCVCVLVSAVFHYQSPQGRKPLLVSAVDTAVFFLGKKNNKLIRGCTSCLLRFNCIRVWVPTESRWSEAETHAA